MKKTFTLLFCLFAFTFTAFTQQTQKTCYTMERADPALYQNPESYPNFRIPGGGTYSNTTGYGAGCTNNCDLSIRMPLAGCNTPPVFQIPMVYRVSTGTGCPTNPANGSAPGPIPSQADLDAMLSITNEYFSCVGMPIELVKCTTYDTDNLAPGFQVQGDGSTVFEPVDCNYDNVNPTTIPNVMNVFIYQDTGNGTGCNGFAALPGGSETIAMSTGCYNSVDVSDYTCGDAGLGVSQVFVHEVGHFLGLFHTHETGAGGCDDPSFPTDDCTSGDFIQDTDEDPDYSGGEICTITNCDTGGPTSNCAFNMASGNCAVYGSPNTINNIMSYNIFQGCIIDFTDCQKAKMLDALLCSNRSELVCCDPALVDNPNAADYMTTPDLVVCVGDTPGSFNVDMPTGGAPALDPSCITWYDDMGNILGTGTTFTPPTAGTGAFDNTIPGTYTYFFDDDGNEYTTTACDDQVLKQVTVVVIEEPGNASAATVPITNCTGPQAIDLDTDVAALGDGCVVGWWITETNPASMGITDDASLNTAVAGATIGTPLGNPANNIIESTGGTPVNDLSLSIDCSADPTATYYATPLVAKSAPEIPDATCVVNAGPTSGITFNNSPGQFNTINSNDVCAPDPVCFPPTFTYCITVSGYTGTPGNLSLVIYEDNTFANSLVVDFFVGTGNGNAMYCYNETDMPGYDPSDAASALTVVVWEEGGTGMQNADISTTLDIFYQGKPAVPFPTIAGYADCLFGTPVVIACNCSACTATASLATNPTAACAADGTVNICIDVDSGDPTEVTIDVDGVMATGAVGATQVCAALTLDANMGCSPITQNYMVGAICNVDNAELVATTMQSITVYPQALTLNEIDNGATCATPAVQLVAMDNTVCATQTKPTACADDNDSFAYDFTTDASDDGYDGTWVTTAPAACMPTVGGTIDCSNCTAVCGATASLSTANPTEACAVDGMVNICVDVDSGDPIQVTINVDGVTATGAVGATEVCVGLPLSVNTGCSPITQNYMVGAACIDNSVLVATTMQSITVYPQALMLNVTDGGTACGTPSVQLLAMDNSVCATQTKATVCVDDSDSFVYDFATDDTDDGYDGTWIANTPTACMPTVSGTINCDGCSPLGCIISNVAIGTAAMCNGADATYEICFDVSGGSGDYDLIDTDNANAVLASVTAQAANGSVCITATVPNSTGSTVNIDIVDNVNTTCSGGTPLSMTIPDCSTSTPPTVDITDPCSCDAGIDVCGGAVSTPPGNIDTNGDGQITEVDYVADVITITVAPPVAGETWTVTTSGDALDCTGTPIAAGTALTDQGGGVYTIVIYYQADGTGFSTMDFMGDMGSPPVSITNPSTEYQACNCALCPTAGGSANAGAFPRN